LAWLGLHHDEGPYFQSQRAAIYRQRCRQLLEAGLAYERDGAIRFRMTREPIVMRDLIAGTVRRELSDREVHDPDFVIVRSDGNPVFHFVNVVDDLEMKITHVIRGEDHLSNTPKHIALFRAFGVEPPQYAHIPMILNKDGTKMSKSDPDPAKARLASLASYIEDGYLPEAVRNYLCLLGWSPKDDRQILPIEEVIQKFDLPQVLRSNAKFDPAKLEWMNGQYINLLSAEELDRRVTLPCADAAYRRKVLDLLKSKVTLLKQFPERTAYFFTDDFPVQPTDPVLLGKLADRYASLPVWDAASLETALKALAAELGVKTGQLIHPCRMAVSGQTVGPSLYPMLEVLGRERVLARLRRVPA
jgi:glutamyl-tRNA synthetase